MQVIQKSGFGIKSEEQAKGKRMLVCFWDMNQRPSRNCLMQLNKRAQELQEKDVIIVAIHASKVDRDTLDKWTKENNIPFQVGIVEGDEEEARFAWGVKSLPWLILTDKEHTVHEEGFSLTELNEKLSKEIKLA